ncbi:MAG: adenosylhomocysteinase [Thermaerobacter sp.]|nr:adenosylhomocysteinase [Thermaerobacter sp.]
MGGSVIRDPALAAEGERKIAWAREHMPILEQVRAELVSGSALSGRRVGICLHLEAKTAVLAITLAEAGAQVYACGSNPLSTQDDVVAALDRAGVRVYALHGATPEEYDAFLGMVADQDPELVIDDGADLIALLARRGQGDRVQGGCEETTTGIVRLKAMEARGELPFPVVAVNNARCKYLFDNRYGTGQSVWDGIMRSTNLLVAGKTVVVVGYGWCGKGVALRARGLGAQVVVCEVDPIAAAEAALDGQRVLPMAQAAPLGDVFITVTGCTEVIRGEHFERMKDGALLANAGHFDVEISKPDLARLSTQVRRVREQVEEYRLADGRRVYLLAEGRLVNLAAGDGHPVEIMDMSFALQAMSLRHVAVSGRLPRQVLSVPAEVDRRVAELRLNSWGMGIDQLTPRQVEYLAAWEA